MNSFLGQWFVHWWGSIPELESGIHMYVSPICHWPLVPWKNTTLGRRNPRRALSGCKGCKDHVHKAHRFQAALSLELPQVTNSQGSKSGRSQTRAAWGWSGVTSHSRLLKIKDKRHIPSETKGREQDHSPHHLFRPSEAACWDVGANRWAWRSQSLFSVTG